MTAAVLPVLTLAAVLCAAAPAHADNCDAIAAQIDAKLKAGRLAGYSLGVVDLGAAKGARVLGSCANGARQIVVVQGGAPAVVAGAASGVALAPRPAPVPVVARRPPPADNIPTECADGSIVLGADCADPRAVRMSRDEISGHLPAAPKPD